MPLWTSNNDANGVPIYATAQLNQTPNTANRNALFQNSTSSGYIAGTTTGVYAVTDAEVNVGYKFLASLAINAAGTAYAPGDVLTANGTGANAVAPFIASVATTKVVSIAANAASGTGYANGDTLTTNTGTVTAAPVFTVTTGTSNTSVASLAVTSGGAFTANPTLTGGALRNLVVANSSANGASANVVMGLQSLSVTDPGHYAVLPSNTTNMAPANTTGIGASGTLYAQFNTASDAGVAHAGWVKRTVGTGGRAGRVQTEVLVSLSAITNEANTNVFPNA